MTEATSGTGRTWWIVGIVLVSGWCLYLRFFGPTLPRGGAVPVLEGTALSNPADYDWMLSDLAGGKVSFDRYRGKTVFLNVWAPARTGRIRLRGH
jgi:hypothetical protein